jgi:hypothetical protein
MAMLNTCMSCCSADRCIRKHPVASPVRSDGFDR